MKVSFFSSIALSSLFISAIAVPTTDVEKRQILTPLPVPVADPGTTVISPTVEAVILPILQTLFATVQQSTGLINSTIAALPANSTAANNPAAVSTVQSAIGAITIAIISATTQIQAVATNLPTLQARQALPGGAGSLVGLVTGLVSEITGTLSGVISALGLGAILPGLGPLVSSLSALLVALNGVVQNLLVVVGQLVNALLTGLALGLAGLAI